MLIKILHILAIVHSVSSMVFTEMISDLIDIFGRNTVVTIFSCEKRESLHLLKKLIQNGYQTSILTMDSEHIDFPIPPNDQMFVVDLKCGNSNRLLKRANELNFFKSPFRWIIYNSRSDTLENILSSYLERLHILVDSDVILCHLQKKRLLIHTVYRRRTNYTLIVETLGYYTKDSGFIGNFIQNNIRKRNNLGNITLKSSIVITNNDSLYHLSDKRYKHIDSITKVNYVLVEHLRDIMNVTLIYSVQSTWGYKNSMSDWSGMIGELTKNEADIGGSPLFFTIDRVDIIDYVAMTTPTRSKFVFKQPKLSYITNVYILPFSAKVWASTVGLLLVAGLILYLSVKWEWRNTEQTCVRPDGPRLRASVIDVALFTFGALCQQGATAIPFSIPGRITTVSLFISLMFLYTSYSANIVALLQSSSNHIRTLEDLLKSKLQLGVDDTVFNRFYFPNSIEPVRKALYLQKIAPKNEKDNFMSIELGVARLREGLFAFHMATGPGYELIGEIFHERDKCELQEIQFLQVVDPWLAVQKNSSYKELIKVGLRKIQESGIQAREVGLVYTKKPVCTARGSTFISVGLVDCYPAAIVLASGFISAFVLFLFEIYYNYRN